MYQINLHHTENKYEFEELTKIFLPPEDFDMVLDGETPKTAENGAEAGDIRLLDINLSGGAAKEDIKCELYKALSKETGKAPAWGTLTGVRPVKLAGKLVSENGQDVANRLLSEKYLLSDKKKNLILDTYRYQQEHLGKPEDRSFGLYVGIPFCPTRCLYCSFTSNQKGEWEIARYLNALYREIEFAGELARKRGYSPESIYIGGGTPTTISADQMDVLLGRIKKAFDTKSLKEFTVEAGRPDTITYQKLGTLLMHGIERISINPQTMKEETLKLIGRAHSADDTRAAMKLASEMNVPYINMDLIAGLPEESPQDFAETLAEILDYRPANITVHTLAVKKASLLIEKDPDYHYRHGMVVAEMLEEAEKSLRNAGYIPYYLYRQKHMTGAFENIGWCRDDAFCTYNIRIMEEQQTIAALGAGGISKQYYPAEDRLERVPNVSNYEIYIERLDEMLERKELNLFK